MRALAIVGPRASESQIKSFRCPQIIFKVLLSPKQDEVSSELKATPPDIVLIFGGDGTVNVHLNQLANTGIPVLVVPCGSGNDLARLAGTDSIDAASAAWGKFIRRELETAAIDLGSISSPKLSQPRYFSCCANVGLDADAARRTDAMPDWLKSSGGYFLGGLMALANYQPQMMTIISDERQHIERGWFVSVSNTPTFGGGLKIAPQASVTDDALDVTFVSGARFSRTQLAGQFPKILSGKHVNIRGLSIFATSALSIETESPFPVYADGEYITETPCQISVAPGALRLITTRVL